MLRDLEAWTKDRSMKKDRLAGDVTEAIARGQDYQGALEEYAEAGGTQRALESRAENLGTQSALERKVRSMSEDELAEMMRTPLGKRVLEALQQ